jgi:hypothetical protein
MTQVKHQPLTFLQQMTGVTDSRRKKVKKLFKSPAEHTEKAADPARMQGRRPQMEQKAKSENYA